MSTFLVRSAFPEHRSSSMQPKHCLRIVNSLSKRLCRSSLYRMQNECAICCLLHSLACLQQSGGQLSTTHRTTGQTLPEYSVVRIGSFGSNVRLPMSFAPVAIDRLVGSPGGDPTLMAPALSAAFRSSDDDASVDVNDFCWRHNDDDIDEPERRRRSSDVAIPLSFDLAASGLMTADAWDRRSITERCDDDWYFGADQTEFDSSFSREWLDVRPRTVPVSRPTCSSAFTGFSRWPCGLASDRDRSDTLDDAPPAPLSDRTKIRLLIDAADERVKVTSYSGGKSIFTGFTITCLVPLAVAFGFARLPFDACETRFRPNNN